MKKNRISTNKIMIDLLCKYCFYFTYILKRDLWDISHEEQLSKSYCNITTSQIARLTS